MLKVERGATVLAGAELTGAGVEAAGFQLLIQETVWPSIVAVTQTALEAGAGVLADAGVVAGAELTGAELAGLTEVAGAEVAGAEVAGAEVAGAELAGAVELIELTELTDADDVPKIEVAVDESDTEVAEKVAVVAVLEGVLVAELLEELLDEETALAGQVKS